MAETGFSVQVTVVVFIITGAITVIGRMYLLLAEPALLALPSFGLCSDAPATQFDCSMSDGACSLVEVACQDGLLMLFACMHACIIG